VNQHLSPDVKTTRVTEKTNISTAKKKVCFGEQQYGNKTSNDDAEQAGALFGYMTVRIHPFGFGFGAFRPLKIPKYTAAKLLAMARKCTLLTKDE